MLVSVIIPCYNNAAVIGEAISSVLTQTHQSLEVLVVDNGSTDDTPEIVRTCPDPRVRLLEVPCRREGGVPLEGAIAKARNHGAAAATGEVLAFLDSDDAWVPDKLRQQLEHLAEPRLSCVASNFIPIGNTRIFVNHLSFARGEPYREFDADDIFLGNAVVASSAIVRKADFFAAGQFDEAAEFFALEDWEFWMRLLTLGPARVLAMPLVKYRIPFARKRDARQVALNSLKAVQKNAANRPANIVRTALANCNASIGRAHLDLDERIGARYYLEALLHGKGHTVRLRSAWGLLLFALPERLRRLMLRGSYFMLESLRTRCLRPIS